jgi:hypothetical protein
MNRIDFLMLFLQRVILFILPVLSKQSTDAGETKEKEDRMNKMDRIR